MTKEKTYSLLLFAIMCTAASAQTTYLPQVHGILRGKYEYEPDLGASRFEVRNAHLSVDGSMPLRSSYPNNGTPKESEQDKLVAELMIRF